MAPSVFASSQLSQSARQTSLPHLSATTSKCPYSHAAAWVGYARWLSGALFCLGLELDARRVVSVWQIVWSKKRKVPRILSGQNYGLPSSIQLDRTPSHGCLVVQRFYQSLYAAIYYATCCLPQTPSTNNRDVSNKDRVNNSVNDDDDDNLWLSTPWMNGQRTWVWNPLLSLGDGCWARFETRKQMCQRQAAV